MMLPTKIRHRLFENLSVKTMRYVESVPSHKADGLVKEIYNMIAEDFFINGSLTSHSQVPNLLAGVWTGGRESILVNDKLDMTTKEAIAALLSRLNDCSYCGDMLVSLVHAAGQHDSASKIFDAQDESVRDPLLYSRLEWVKAAVDVNSSGIPDSVFTDEQIPEVIATIVAMGHINRVSHVTMDGSPVSAPMGFQEIKRIGLRSFGTQLKDAVRHKPVPGRALYLLPKSELPEDMKWAERNSRIADAFARWAAVVERESAGVISAAVKNKVRSHIRSWNGERVPLSRSWAEEVIEGFKDEDYSVAKLALLAAKASFQIDDGVVRQVLRNKEDQAKLVRVLAWGAFTGSRRIGEIIWSRIRAKK